LEWLRGRISILIVRPERMFYAYRVTVSGEKFFIIAPSPAFNTFFRQAAPEESAWEKIFTLVYLAMAWLMVKQRTGIFPFPAKGGAATDNGNHPSVLYPT